MSKTAQKGVIILTITRSGSSWLGSIARNAGTMGTNDESLGFEQLEKPRNSYKAESYYQDVMRHAQSQNGRFSLKIFPRHLRECMHLFNFDFIHRCARENDVKFILLRREDRLAQAISLVRADQTGRWNSDITPEKSKFRPEPVYRFKSLCDAYFHIGRAYDFWESYLGIYGLSHESFTYEALQQDPAPYFETVAKHLDVPKVANFESPLKIQRNDSTAEWRERFLSDIQSRSIHPDSIQPPQPFSGLHNALRVFTGKPAKISFYGINT